MREVLIYLIFTLGLINMIHFCMYLAGANLYDIKRFKQQAKSKQRSSGKSLLVSVLVPAHNEATTIIRCLDSIRTNTHRKLEIIVIDDASTDETAALVRKYIKQHATRDIRLIQKRRNVGKGEALNTALRRYATGDLVMTLDADSVLDKKAIKHAIKYFDDPQVVGLAANVRIMDDESILGLVQRFEHMIGYRSKKFYSVTNSEYIIGGVASTYRREVLKRVRFYDTDTITEDIGLSLKVISQGNQDQRVVYAADVAAMTEGVGSFPDLLRQRYRWKLGSLQNLMKYRALFMSRAPYHSRMLTWYRIPFAFFGEALLLLEPLCLAYIFILSIQIQNPILFASAYVTISLYLLWNIWPDEHMSTKQKLQMTFYVPVMYFLFFLMNIVQIAAAIRCILNFKQVLKSRGSTWISPARQAVQTHSS